LSFKKKEFEIRGNSLKKTKRKTQKVVFSLILNFLSIFHNLKNKVLNNFIFGYYYPKKKMFKRSKRHFPVLKDKFFPREKKKNLFNKKKRKK
jgi:hypothetical protein